MSPCSLAQTISWGLLCAGGWGAIVIWGLREQRWFKEQRKHAAELRQRSAEIKAQLDALDPGGPR
jgi:hypothetical protein